MIPSTIPSIGLRGPYCSIIAPSSGAVRAVSRP